MSADDKEPVSITEQVLRDMEALYRWDLAERDAVSNDYRRCPDCHPDRGKYCGAHQCSACTATGGRCSNHVADNPAYCRTHQCTVGWELDGETVTCTNPATTQTLPDGRRFRICDQHHATLSA